MLITAVGAVIGYKWLGQENPDLHHKIEELMDFRYVNTLEIRYGTNEILDTYRRDLFKDNGSKYLDSMLKFYPFLLLEVKYNQDGRKTKEGWMLWDLLEGEMLLDTRSWQKTHGFADCITANVQPQEFKIIQFLIKKGGAVERQGLDHSFTQDTHPVSGWIRSCLRKNLIMLASDGYRLHLENPKMPQYPETKVDAVLVTKPLKGTIRVPKRFTKSQIERMSKIAFGNDFFIRNSTEIYLPVHVITIKKMDGSLETFHWNALTGKRLSKAFFYE